MHRNQLATLALAAVLPLLVACEQDAGEDPQDTSVATETSAETTDSVMGIGLVRVADVELASIDRSGVTGRVEGEPDGEGASLTLTLDGLEPGSVYPAHLHSGRCAAGGPVVVPLGRVTAEQDGTGSLTAEVEGTELAADEPLFVQAHNPDGDAVACGDLSEHSSGLTDQVDPENGVDAGNQADPEEGAADTGSSDR